MALNVDTSSWLQANISGIDVPVSFWVTLRTHATANTYTFGMYTSLAFNARGIGAQMNNQGTGNPNTILGSTSGSQSHFGGANCDTGWHTHGFSLDASGNSLYSFDLNVSGTATGQGDWNDYNANRVGIGNIPDWFGAYASGGADSDHQCVAVWNAALTAAEFNQLYYTRNPAMMRPQNLVLYHPMINTNYNQGAWGGNTFARSGSSDPTDITHQPMKMRF